ncbi:tonsoku-like protein [Protopterus annectens]|uniref:tonsoku-like protein n=1 Tax=Protopterus annectens TaxID=7888 RepID=UPI001CFBDDC6|nr:tonsoku-like protein [Protopterus annectens]
MSFPRELKQLQKAKAKAQKNNNLREEATICNQLGELLAKNGQYQEAIEEHRQELQLCEVLKDVIGAAVANRKIGESCAELGKYGAALKHQRRHLDLARSVSNIVEEQRAWATIGRTYLYKYETDQSHESLKEAENAFLKSLIIVDEKLEGVASQRDLSEMRARLYLNLGFVYDGLKDAAKCSFYISKSVFIAEQNLLYEDLYRAKFNMGSIHFRNGQHSKAIRCLEAAKECARKMKEKHMESECFASIGKVLLNLGDFVAAKRSLKKAYILGSNHPQERENVRKNLKYAIKGCRLEEAISELPKGEYQELLIASEQLGDLLCKAGCYQKAAECYKTQLKCAETLKRPDRELAVIYVSLATTFGDLKDYKQAVSHYEEELRLRKGNPTEECRTLLNIALNKEEDGQDYAELEKVYQNALLCSKQAAQAKLQHQVLKLLHSAQLKFKCPEADATLAQMRELSVSSEESGDDSEEEPENSEPLVESDLELSDSDDEDDLEGYNKSVPGRRAGSNRWNRRNEKGETVLHRACIEGNLKQVEYVVGKGHPINPRDYCGWTPLHEACNHGHLEIVKFLLDHGANINDPGGPGCEGITPLHDALTCGNLEVAQLLIEHGATVTQKNAKGATPSDSLQEWITIYGKHLDEETWQRCRRTEQLLKAAEAGKVLQVLQPTSNFQDSELFDDEHSQSQSQLPDSSLSRPSDHHALQEKTRKHWHQNEESFTSSQSSALLSANQRTSKQRSCHQSAVDVGSFDNRSPASHGQQSRSSRRDDLERCKKYVPEEYDEPISPLRAVKKRPRLLVGQMSPTNSEGGPISPLPLTNLSAESDEEHDDFHGLLRKEEEMDLGIPNEGKNIYLNTIRNLGSAKSRLLAQTLSEPVAPAAVMQSDEALIPANEYVADDWLEDDLGMAQPKKRMRRNSQGKIANRNGKPASGTDDNNSFVVPDSHSASVTSSRMLSLKKKKPRQMRMTQIVDRAVVGRTKAISESSTQASANFSIPRVIGSNRELDVVPNLGATTSLVSLQTHPSVMTSAVIPPLRVRVRVEDSIFLIPVPHSDSETRTVSWLAEQASQRYYQTCGLFPRISLKKEGALLSPQDLILEVLQSNEEVLADVQSWDLPPLSDRYKKACGSLSVAPNQLVLKITEQQNSTQFSLNGLCLRSHDLTPILRALKLQTSTQQLILSGNCISDDVMEELWATVSTMPNLRLLDLSSNQITHEGLKKLCDTMVASSTKTLKNLEELNLSTNMLGDSSCQYLASIIKSCPLLCTLRLQGCGFTAKLLQHYRLLMVDAMKGALHLKMLSLSYNALGPTGVELILKTLPHDVITQLEIGCINSGYGDKNLMDHIVRYLAQDGCALTHLNLMGNRLTDETVRDLARCLLVCPSLTWLDLSANPGITCVGLEMMIAAVEERNSGLKHLNLAGSIISWTS